MTNFSVNNSAPSGRLACTVEEKTSYSKQFPLTVILAPPHHDLGVEQRGAGGYAHVCGGDEAGMRVGDDRIGQILEIRILTQHDALGLGRIVGIHRVDFRGGLRCDVSTRIGREVDFNVEPVALQDAARGRDDKDARQVGQRLVPV